MSKLKYYVEMQTDEHEPNESGTAVIHAFDNQVLVWIKGGVKTHHADDIEEKLNEIVNDLESCGYRLVSRKLEEADRGKIF